MMTLKLSIAAAIVATVAGHGSMITPPPRSAHGQKYDAANKCSCTDTGNCYSNITGVAQYCGLGCLGEACLYYQIGCYAGCGTCSYSGKDLYPTEEDLELAGECKPIEPTLPEDFRSYNIDDLSTQGDWTKVNPWRAPGTAGLGNPAFQPCGINSGWNSDHPVRGSAGPPAGGAPTGANGTDLPAVGAPTVWQAGKTAEVEFSIYANHAGGYSYRLCKAGPNGEITEASCQQMPLEFATDNTQIKYYDGSRQPFMIPARTTSVGTHPAGSQWRLNPIPMCNCDQGAYCKGEEEDAELEEPKMFHRILQEQVEGKECKAVTRAECGTNTGVNTCLKCGSGTTYNCTECCPGLQSVSKSGYTYCVPGKGPTPTPAPSPPKPAGKCGAVLEEDCGAAQKQGTATCDNCLKAHWSALTQAGCSASDAGGFCKGDKPSPAPSPPKPAGKCGAVLEEDCGKAQKQGKTTCDNCLKAHWSAIESAGCSAKDAISYCGGMSPKPGGKGGQGQFTPYAKTYFRPGQTSTACPTGLMFNASWDEGVGSGPQASGYGRMPFSMTDTIKVPNAAGRYTLSWRWDCEQTPQVWNSCADIVIE